MHVNARFKRRDEEFSWLMAGKRAARRILEACRYGEPALTLTWQAKTAMAANALAPNLVARCLELAASFLLAPPWRRGRQAAPAWQSSSRGSLRPTVHR